MHRWHTLVIGKRSLRMWGIAACAAAFVVLEPMLLVEANGRVLDSREQWVQATSLLARSPLERRGSIRVTATGYSSDPHQTDDTPFITAAGTAVRHGVVAANFLPFGTKLIIPVLSRERVFVVEDRMNRRYNDELRLDVWHSDYESAKRFGVKEFEIIVL